MEKYKKNDIVTGYVTGIENYGIFVNLDDNHDGLVHISEITSSYVRNIHDYAKIGDLIKVKVIEDEKTNHIKLSIKDVDYRLNNKKNSQILETTTGFFTLNKQLNQWIETKYEEILQKNKKNQKKC